MDSKKQPVFNEQSDMADIVMELKRRVKGLLRTYFALIVGTLLLFVAVLVAVCAFAYSLYTGDGISIWTIFALVGVVIVAGICVGVVLKPLFSLFSSKKNRGEEIRREDYPDLFAMIDDVVAQAGCQQPKHVYISNENNAYVWYPNLWGYISPRRQNLTIGLPLLTVLNKTEMKAIISHEFGHFTQKSVKMNRIANLSEFICASINQSLVDAMNADDNSYEANARLFVSIVTKIMTKQYQKVAPLNGILSRAQEFDADAYSYQITGSAAAISSLSKISYFSEQWRGAMGYIQHLMHDEERSPQDVKMVIDTVLAHANANWEVGLAPSAHLTKPIVEFASRISWVNNDTHPSMKDRCSAIECMPVRETAWDDAPALSYFSDDKVRQIFNSVLNEMSEIMFANRTVFLKRNVTEDEVKNAIDASAPGFLGNFYSSTTFFSDETSVNDSDIPQNLVEFPFTEANAEIISEYNVAASDLNTLQQVAEENSPKRSFFYENTRYTGTNVPIQKHMEYYEPLHEKAVQIAKDCNCWMMQKSQEDKDMGAIYRLWFETVVPCDQIRELEHPMDIVSGVNRSLYSDDTVTVRKEYVDQVDSYLRTYAEYLMAKDCNGRSRFEMMAEWLGVEKEISDEVEKYFASTQRDSNKQMVTTFRNLDKIIRTFLSKSWDMLTTKWIMPEIRNNK